MSLKCMTEGIVVLYTRLFSNVQDAAALCDSLMIDLSQKPLQTTHCGLNCGTFFFKHALTFADVKALKNNFVLPLAIVHHDSYHGYQSQMNWPTTG